MIGRFCAAAQSAFVWPSFMYGATRSHEAAMSCPVTAVLTKLIAVCTTSCFLDANEIDFEGVISSAFSVESLACGSGFGPGKSETSPATAATATASTAIQTSRRRKRTEESFPLTAAG